MLILAIASLAGLQKAILLQSFDERLDPAHPARLGRYVSPGRDGHAVWVIRGKNFTVDLKGIFLSGNSGKNLQEKNIGIGILLDGCQNVTLKNADISGFRFNILCRDSSQVTIESCSANGSRAIRMQNASGPVDTFLNLRDLAAWRTYGSGIWLERSLGCEVSKSSATGAQNGILLVDCNKCNVVNNNCSFNGGWGLGVWGGARNTLAWNHADFCNRPWSGGWGGDAAGIVVANGAYSNQFIANSITHGGDGFFLTDKVNGGFDEKTKTFQFSGASNNNFVAHNDGSWSSHNAFEGTFSQFNLYYANIANDSKYGFWLGFSNSSFMYENQILRAESDGVAIGQGSSNLLFRNSMEQCGKSGIHLWSEGGAAEKACPSIDNQIVQNRISGCKTDILAERSLKLTVFENTLDKPFPSTSGPLAASSMRQTKLLGSWKLSPTAKRLDGWFAKRPKGWQFYRETALPKGPSAILAGEYSPRPAK